MQSETCSASSLAGSRMIALGVRTAGFSFPPVDAASSASTEETAMCSGRVDASGVQPFKAAVEKLKEACGVCQ